VVILVFVALVFGGWWGYHTIRNLISPPDYAGNGYGQALIQINLGDSASDIGNTLVQKDVVKSARAFADAAAEDKRATSLQPGTYQLHKHMKASLALQMLLDPSSRVSRRFTLPEGKSVLQTFKIIHDKTAIPMKDLELAANDPSQLGLPTWVKADLLGSARLEGFLFPSTYEVQPNATAVDVLKMMVARANEVFIELNFEQTAHGLGQDPYAVLTTASLIEGEGITRDFGKISRVIYNRLATAPYFLNFDSTTQYWLEKSGQGRSKKLSNAELRNPDNNYSTTTHPGLPPSAVANPGKAALQAALAPEPGPWMYFVLIDKDGTSAFAVTQEEQNANIQICKEKNLGC
jgi:UPF0755 protein